jgi:hypothetical protein
MDNSAATLYGVFEWGDDFSELDSVHSTEERAKAYIESQPKSRRRSFEIRFVLLDPPPRQPRQRKAATAPPAAASGS